jgi:hypothetical protein
MISKWRFSRRKALGRPIYGNEKTSGIDNGEAKEERTLSAPSF